MSESQAAPAVTSEKPAAPAPLAAPSAAGAKEGAITAVTTVVVEVISPVAPVESGTTPSPVTPRGPKQPTGPNTQTQPSPALKPVNAAGISDGPDVSFLRSYLERVRPRAATATDAELREHAFDIQEEAIEQDFVMKFILDMTFLRPRIDSHFAYRELLSRLGADRDRRLVDVGCGLGTDLRSLVLSGVPESQLFGVDRHSALIDLGYLLFRDKGKSYVTFYAEDFLRVNVPNGVSLDAPQRLEDLFGRVHAATAISVLHLLDEVDVQCFLARAFALLQPGGLLVGRSLASDRPGVFRALPRPACFSCTLLCARGPLVALTGCWNLSTRCVTCSDRGDSRIRYLHSPETLADVLQKAGFVNVRVEIHSALPQEGDSLRSVPEGTPAGAKAGEGTPGTGGKSDSERSVPEGTPPAAAAAAAAKAGESDRSVAASTEASLRSVADPTPGGPKGTPPASRRSLRFVVTWAAEKPGIGYRPAAPQAAAAVPATAAVLAAAAATLGAGGAPKAAEPPKAPPTATGAPPAAAAAPAAGQ